MNKLLRNYISFTVSFSSSILPIVNMKNFYHFNACLFGVLTIYAAGTVNTGCLEKEEAIASLEMAESLLRKARVSFPSCEENGNSTDESECRGKKPLAYIELSKKLIADVIRNYPTCSESIEKDEKTVNYVTPRDCSEILSIGPNVSGVYPIWVGETSSPGKPLLVYCDMDTDDGGWTVIQRRGKFPVQQDFFLGWDSYKNGFGNISEEFWLGNENIRVLCYKGCEIRFDMQDERGEKGFALYKNFNLTRDDYRISISGHTGTLGDDMKRHNNYDFSTKDKGLTKRANTFKGAWWYRSSNDFVNLNGLYKPVQTEASTVHWYTWRKWENLASVEIKVRPTQIE